MGKKSGKNYYLVLLKSWHSILIRHTMLLHSYVYGETEKFVKCQKFTTGFTVIVYLLQPQPYAGHSE